MSDTHKDLPAGPGRRLSSPGEQPLSQIAQRYRLLFDHGPAAIIVYDQEGRILEASKAAADLLGLPCPSLPGRALGELLGPELTAAQEAALTGKPAVREGWLTPASSGGGEASVRSG